MKNTKNAYTIQCALKKLANPQRAKILQGFFKTAPGEYAEGDIFLGIQVPVLRTLASSYDQTSLLDIQDLLHSPIHEERLLSLFLLIRHFDKAKTQLEQKRIVSFYLRNLRWVNNWDLVDLSAPNILGKYLLGQDKHPLEKLASSHILWHRRVSIVSTLAFIRKEKFGPTCTISKMLMHDSHDLIHKACGWMLREVGKRSEQTLIMFLDQNAATMPRTMLRYAIERLDEKTRQGYLLIPRKNK